MNKTAKLIYVLACLIIFLGSLFVSKNYNFEKYIVQEIETIDYNQNGNRDTGRAEEIDKEIAVSDNQKYDPEIDEIVESDTYIGNWKRIKMTINDEDWPSASASLILREGYFKKITDCLISGDLIVEDGKMTMSVSKDDCNQGEKVLVSDYVLSEDKNNLTLMIKDSKYEVRDLYQRINK